MSHPLQQDLEHILRHTGDLWEALRNQNVFITGGTGFVGTWLVESLVWADQQLDLNARATLLTRDPDRFRRKAPYAANHSAIRFLQGDAATFDLPAEDFGYLIHASTERQFEPTPEHPTGMFDADVAATRRVLSMARNRNTRRLLFTSSGAAYGRQQPELTHIPEDYAGAPETTDRHAAYGEAKRAGEFLCSAHARQYGFEAPIARLFAFVGPHLPLDLNFAAGNFIGDVLRGGPVRIAGDGTPIRSYLYAADMAIWLWTILLRGASARIYNVGSPDAVSITQLAEAVVRATIPDTRIEIAKQPTPGAPALRYVPSVDRAGAELGLAVRVPLDEALRRTYLWHSLRHCS